MKWHVHCITLLKVDIKCKNGFEFFIFSFNLSQMQLIWRYASSVFIALVLDVESGCESEQMEHFVQFFGALRTINEVSSISPFSPLEWL